MKASIIAPTYGSRLEYLRDTLVTVQDQDFPAEQYEIIVVDNGPLGGVSKLVEELNQNGRKSIQCVKETAPGSTNARHAGARKAQGEILVFIDDDVILRPECLRNVLEPYRDPKVGCTGGKVVLRYEGTPPDWMSQFGTVCHSALDLGEKTLELSWPACVWGAIMTVPKKVLFEVGGFNPDIFGDPSLWWLTGDGECGFEKKIFDAGYKIVYEPKVSVVHRIPPSRLTLDYFRHRLYTNGLMDSYTLIRAAGAGASTATMLLRSAHAYFMTVRKMISSLVRPKWRVKASCQSARWRAFAKHQLRAALDAKLRAYICQKSYV